MTEEKVETGEKEKTTKKATKATKHSWIKIKPEELKKIVVDLAKKGESPAKIGLILRDKYGVPKAKLLGKKIIQILKEADTKYRTDKDVVEAKVSKLKSHITKNKHDHPASRALTKRLWDIYHLNQKAS